MWCAGFLIQWNNFIHTEAGTIIRHQEPLQCFRARRRADSCMGASPLSVQLLRGFIVWGLVQHQRLAQPELCPTFMLYSWIPALPELRDSGSRGDFHVHAEGLLPTGGNMVPGSPPFRRNRRIYSGIPSAVWSGVIDGAVLHRSSAIWIQDIQSRGIAASSLNQRHSVSKAQKKERKERKEEKKENGTSHTRLVTVETAAGRFTLLSCFHLSFINLCNLLLPPTTHCDTSTTPL